MTTAVRKSGLRILGDMRWGTHFCQFYETKQDLLDISVPFLVAGVEQNELGLWIVSPPLTEEEAEAAVRRAMPGGDGSAGPGNIEIASASDWFFANGSLDLRRAITGFREKLVRALADGYEGLRIVGNDAPLTEQDWREYGAYEADLNAELADLQMVVLCTYSALGVKAAGLLDIARAHQFALAKRQGSWEVLETTELKQAKAEIARLNAELEHRVAERTSELEASREELRTLFAAMTDLVVVVDHEGRFVKVAPTDAVDAYLPPGDPIGKTVSELLPADVAGQVLDEIREVLDTGRPVTVEYKLSIDSREAWFEGRASALTASTVFWTVRDVTRRREAVEGLERTLKELRQSMTAIVGVVAQIVETRDPYTAGHQRRVADLARSIAAELHLSADTIEGIGMGGMVHDIGKIAVPAEILSKPGRLSLEEFALIKGHPQTGAEILGSVQFPWPLSTMVEQHHERMDGSGYPLGLKGAEITLEARIMAVADVVEAMASHRPYRPSLGVDAALAEIEAHKGVLYDADVVDASIRLFRERGYELVQG